MALPPPITANISTHAKKGFACALGPNKARRSLEDTTAREYVLAVVFIHLSDPGERRG